MELKPQVKERQEADDWVDGPTCSYNECRGCRFRCSAEQVPVDANDPINSAYHYRCVCHKRE
ncbi:unnamed protein product [Spirodela intermedia]|uniref:Stomagen C-terminal domain-containing protein n=1 Tax=Spirodela intermedia TaxID=51605 RepID=A0A7I8JDU3_SPIIN|nr:unnamed protein product [Spirodela intermedia]CAA6668181.1 unnamed protein product [Spirodela intermedia]